MIGNRRVSRKLFLLSTIFVYSLVISQFVGVANANLIEQSKKSQEDTQQFDDLHNDEVSDQKIEEQVPSEDVSLAQTESTPLSRFRRNHYDPLLNNQNLHSKEEAQNKDDLGFHDIVHVTQKPFKIQDGNLVADESSLLTSISQSQNESKNNQEQIANKLKQLREAQEKHNREEHEFVKIQEQNDYLNELTNRVKKANKFVSSEPVGKSNQMDDIDEDLKKIVNPNLLHNVIEHEKQQTVNPTLQKIFEDQKKREQEAYQMNIQRLEEEKIRNQKIAEDIKRETEEAKRMELERQKAEQQLRLQQEEEQRKRDEEERIRQEEERKREEQQRQLEEEQRKQEEERQRLEQEERQRQEEERQRQEEEERQRQEQERIRQEQEAEKQRQLQLEEEARQRAIAEEQERIRQEQERQRQEEERQRQLEEQRRLEEQQKQQEYEAEVQRQLQLEEEARRQAEFEEQERIRKENEAEMLRQQQEEARRQQEEQDKLRAEQERIERIAEEKRLEAEHQQRMADEEQKAAEEARKYEEQEKLRLANQADQIIQDGALRTYQKINNDNDSSESEYYLIPKKNKKDNSNQFESSQQSEQSNTENSSQEQTTESEDQTQLVASEEAHFGNVSDGQQVTQEQIVNNTPQVVEEQPAHDEGDYYENTDSNQSGQQFVASQSDLTNQDNNDQNMQQLKDLEDFKRQQLKEQKLKAQQQKEQEQQVEQPQQQINIAQNVPEIVNNPDVVSSVDEFGNEFFFDRANQKIPLVLPGEVSNDVDTNNMKLLGQNLQTKIINENGHHLDKNTIKQQRERAEKFKFVSSKNKVTQVTPNGDSIEKSKDESQIKPTNSNNEKFLKKKDSQEQTADSSSLPSNVAILCNDINKASSKSVQHVCELCEVGEVFSLTEDNWYKVGLAHNHKKEYQDLLNQVNNVFGKTNLIVGFSKHGDICLSSEQIFNPVNVDLALKTFTYNSLSQYQLEKNPIFSFQPQVQVDEFTFRTSYNKEKKNNEEILVPEYNNFQMIINGQFFRKVDSSTNLNILNIVFLQNKLTTFYFGQISINSYSAQVHFQHDIDQRDHDTINIVIELPSDQMTFQRQAFKMFSQDNLQRIVQNMQLPRGIKSIENVRISNMMITLNLQLNVYQIIMNYDEIVDFALNMNMNLNECTGWVMVQKDSLNNQFFLESNNLICQVEQLPKYTRIHIKKTNTNSSYYIRFADDEYTLYKLNQDVFYQIHNSPLNKGKFQEALKNLVYFEEVYVHDVKIEVFFEPKVIFDVKATIGAKGLKTIGEFRSKFTRVNGRITQFTSFTFGAENINDVFEIKKSDLVSTKPKSFYIFYAGSDINTKEYPYLTIGDFGPSNQEQWTEGVYFQYVFDLDESSNIGRFLNYHQAQVNDLTIKGYYKDFFILFSGNIGSVITVADPIQLRNISINIPISLADNSEELTVLLSENRVESLAQIQYARFYLSAEYDLKVTYQKTLHFQGILNFQKDNQGYLLAESKEPWVDAFGKKDLLLSEIMFKGKLNEEVNRLESFNLNALSMFGGECFTEMENDPVPRFDVERCFYGNSQIKVNFFDYNQDLFVSYINQVNPSNILQVLLGYNQVKIATTVAKPISNMQFPKGLSISFTQDNIKDANGQIHVPKGFTLTGYAELLGLRGHIVLNVNHDRYMLGLFKFEQLTMAGGNIVMVETEGGRSNNVILRLQNDNQNIGEINQVYFSPQAFIFNLQRQIQVSITKEQGYNIELLDKFFGSQDDIAMRISAPFVNEIEQAQFSMMAIFTPQHLRRLNTQLVKLTKDWMNRTQNLFIDLAQRVSEVQKDLINLNKLLCDKETCPLNQQCSSTPRSECIKYHQKQVCNSEEVICLEEQIVCSQEVEICSEKAVTCKSFDESDPTVCTHYEESCVQFIKKCNLYESVCVSEEIKVCTKNKFVDDHERCIERQMVCDVELIKDTNCQQECDRKKEEFEAKTRVFDKFTNALTNFQRRNQKFTEMVNYALDNQDSFVSLIEAKFNEDLTKLVNESNIRVEFSVQSFTIINRVGQDIQNYTLENYDFRNEEQMVRQLFRKMQLYWASQHSIDEILIQGDSLIVLHDILNRINDKALKQEADTEDPQMNELLQLGAKNRSNNFSK